MTNPLLDDDHSITSDDEAGEDFVIRRTSRGRTIAVVACGAIVTLLLAVVILNMDSGDAESAEPEIDVTQLIDPHALPTDQRQGGTSTANSDIQIAIERGWIQVADEQGRLAQQYKCDRLTPNPDGRGSKWIEMAAPRAEIYSSRHRVITMSSNSALAYRPNRALESGTLVGDVVIRMYEVEGGGRELPRDAVPAMTIRTDEAVFDNFLGEVRCEGWIRITSPSVDFAGTGLRVNLNDEDKRIEHLRIDALDYIRFASVDKQVSPDRSTARSPRNDRAADNQGDRERPAASDRPPAPTEAVEPPQFYRMTLTSNVRIVQGDSNPLRTASGDVMRITFSMENSGLGETIASRRISHTRDTQLTWRPGGVPLIVATSVLGLTADQQASDPLADIPPDRITTVTCDGPVEMRPFNDDAWIVTDPDEFQLRLTGDPVELRDVVKEATAFAAELQYNSLDDRIELKSNTTQKVEVDSPDLRATGDEFWMSRTKQLGGFVGAGWMSGAAGGMIEVSPSKPEITPGPSDEEQLSISWTDGVDLEFGDPDGEDGGSIKSALFRGQVQVLNPEFVLRAGEMQVAFPPEAQDTDRIEAIDARGDVQVDGLASGGSIRCGKLRVELNESPDGDMLPSRMLATENVAVVDDAQSIWADSLDVGFRPRGDRDESANTESMDTGDVEIESVLAEKNVQVRLESGTRAFADRLIGDGINKTLVLSGENVLIMDEKMIIDRGTFLEVSEATRAAQLRGKGRLRLFKTPFDLNSTDRIPHPEQQELSGKIDDAQVSATWSRNLHYDHGANDGAGSLRLEGEVNAISSPNPLEVNTVSGDVLTMEFAHLESPRSTAGSAEQSESDGELPLDAHSRELDRLIIRGDAKVESRTWINADHSDTPRVFYVAGRHVEYAEREKSADVIGDGRMLVVDERITGSGSSEGATAEFGGKGRTLFKWTQQLKMRRESGTRYNVSMSGDVEVLHDSLSGGKATLTCDTLTAAIDRADAGQSDVELDFGGTATVQRLRADGRVFVRTPTRDIECGSFDYNRITGVADLEAPASGIITVATRSTASPLTARRIKWNMRTDSITILNAGGAAPR